MEQHITVLVYNSSLETTLATISEQYRGENVTIEHNNDEVFSGVHTNSSCTPLSQFNLMDVFTRMDIGNTEFWGNKSITWMTCFIIYYILFPILLVIMACIYIYFLRRLWRFFVCILILFIMWSGFSCVHYTLLMNSIVNGSNMQLSNTSRALEIIASSSFMNFAILAILLKLDTQSSQKYLIFFSTPIFLITGLIIGVSLFAGSSAIIAVIVFRFLIFIANIVLVNLDIDYKNCLKTKEQFRLLWTERKLLICLYFFISCAYFSYMLITVASNSSCIEDIQLHRAIWLVFNCLLRICEISFSIVYFLKIKKKLSISKSGLKNWIKSKQEVHKSPLKSSSFIYHPSTEIDTKNSSSTIHDHNQPSSLKTDNIFSKNLCEPETIKKQKVQIAIDPMNIRSGTIEIEPLFQNPNLSNSCDSEKSTNTYLGSQNMEQWSFSTVTCSLSTDVSQSLKSVTCSDESLFIPIDFETSSIINEVVIISAKSPMDTEYLIGGTEVKMFDERGGIFHSYNHGVTVIVPPEAIPSGILAELKFAATLVAPVKFTCATPVSAIFWLCMEVMLQKPIQIRLPHMFIKNKADTLRFAKSLHSPVRVIEQQMNVLDDGKVITGQSYASIEVDHFCYYCIVHDKMDLSEIPENQYLLVAMKQHHLSTKDYNWNVHVCVVPMIRTCVKYLKSQYNDDWKSEVLLQFNFEDGCDKLQIEFPTNLFDNAARVEVLCDMKIRQEDVDFHQYYSNGRVEDLKFRMDQKLYPPRRKVRVQAKHRSFFESSKSIDFQLVCDKKCINGKIIIPSINDTYEASSSESDSSLQRNKSITSGYRSKSEESIEQLPDENVLLSGELQLRNLILQTKKIEHRWFELGIALGIPIDKLERIYVKHNGSPVKALIRVYRYWLADKNDLQPTWKKLATSLQKIDEYSLSASIAKYVPQDDNPHPGVFNGASHESNQSIKELVVKHIQPNLIDFPTLVPVLNKYNLLTQSDNYTLMNRLIPPVERANALIYEILASKGPEAYRTFVKCLQEETEHLGHQELARKLTEKSKRKETTV